MQSSILQIGTPLGAKLKAIVKRLEALEVTAPLGPKEGVKTIAKRLGVVAAFYSTAALIGAAAVLLVAFLGRLPSYLPENGSLTWLLIAWSVLTAILIILLIYRSTLAMTEDNQLFLHDSASEQAQIRQKVSRLDSFVTALGTASGTLALVIVAVVIYFQHMI